MQKRSIRRAVTAGAATLGLVWTMGTAGAAVAGAAAAHSGPITQDGYVCTVVGTNKADTLVGHTGDVVCGLGGNDHLTAVGGGTIVLIGGKGADAVPPADRARLMTLPLRYIEARHRLGLIDSATEERLLMARRAFAQGLPESLRGAVEFYDFERYNSAATLQDNVLFGRLVYGQAQADVRIGTLVSEVLNDLKLRDSVIDVGLEYNVGVAGKRLPATQRQKLGIARALIKRPQLLIVNEAVAVFDGRTQDRIRDNILGSAENRGVVWIANRPNQAEVFQQVVVMKGGRVAEQGSPADLEARGGLYKELVTSA